MSRPSSTEAVRHLRDLRAAAAAGRAIEPAITEWIVRAIDCYLAQAPAVTLDAALGLAPGWRGGDGWWVAETRSMRDAAIARIDRSLFGHLDVTAAARSLIAIERRHRERKAGLGACEAELLAELQRCGRGIPGERQLKTIIARERKTLGAEIKPMLKLPDMNYRTEFAHHHSDYGMNGDANSCGTANR